MEIELLEEPKTTELTVTARAALALSSEQTRKDLKELVAKSANIREVKNAAGRDECHGAAMALVRARTTITKTGKAAREDAAAFQKAVIAAEKDLIAITEGEEARLLALRDAWDDARAAEKAEAERIERVRVEQIHLRIADIREAGNLALQCRTSDMVMALIEKMLAAKVEGFEEFADEAEKVRHDTLARMDEIFGTKKAEEQERARIKAEQEAEAARLAAERAENARIAADLERQRKEAAEAERIAAQERAQQEAKAKAARDAAEAAAKAIRDAEAKRLADERAAFEAEQQKARADAQAQADELARQRAEFQAEQDRRAAEAKALETTVTEIQPEQVEVTGPAPLAATDTDPFQQADGSDELDGPQEPSDADVIAWAAASVADRFGMSFNEALNRLAEVQEWIQVEVAA